MAQANDTQVFKEALGRIGFSVQAQDAVVAQGFVSVALLGLVTSDQVKQLCKLIREDANNPVTINMLQQQMLLAMRHWVVNRQRLGQLVNAEEFTAITAFEQSQLMVRLQEDEVMGERDLIAKMPDKFKQPSQWRVFAELVETYLSQLKGSGRVALNYVIRKLAAPNPEAVYETDAEQAVAIAPLIGEQYNRDNAKVYGILKQLCLEGPGRSYILDFDKAKDGRGAWLAMCGHYEGDSYRNRAKMEAYATLDNIHYEGERKGFTFEKFVEKHNECYLELSRHNEPVYEDKKVRDFLNRITAPELQAAKQQVRANEQMMGSFQLAANFIALSVTPLKQSVRQIATTDTSQGQQGRGRGRGGRGNRGGRNQSGVQGRGRGGNSNTNGRGRGRGTGQRGRGGRASDATGYYTYEQWSALTREQKDSILEARGTKRNIAGVETVDGAQQPPPNENAATNGANTAAGAGDEFGRRGRQRTNYIGMLRSYQRHACNVETTERIIARIHQKDDVKIGEYIELDSHADTSVIGNNCQIISYTNKTCQVAPYHPKYKSMQDIPVVQAGTAYDDPKTGETIILIINQGLYFGDSLPVTLLNPNQMRMNGLEVDDVPKHLAKDPSTATHSIYIPEQDIRIPLSMKGVISCLPVRKPTIQEIETCRWVALTSEAEWDPHSEEFEANEIRAHENEDIVINVERDIFAMRSLESPEIQNQITPVSLLSNDELLPRVIKSISISNVQSSQRKNHISQEDLARMWKIGLNTANSTLKATTQLAIRHALHPLHRRFRTEAAQLRYPRLGGRFGRFSSDTMFAKCQSIRGNTMAQVFTNNINFTKLIPMRRKAEAGDSLIEFIQDVGIPAELHTDGSKEQTLGKWGQILRKYDIKSTQSEPYSPWQVRAEGCIREVKKSTRQLMANTRAPKCLWDYCAVYVCEIRSLTVHPHFASQGRTPYELVTGRTPDISEYVEFEWYELLWYYDHEDFPEDRRRLGRWLGVAHRVGQACCYYILPESGQPIVRSTVQKITADEQKSTNFQEKQKAFDSAIEVKLGQAEVPIMPNEFLIDEDASDMYEPFDPEGDLPEADAFDAQMYDQYISAEIMVPQGDVLVTAKVIGRKHDQDGNPIGIGHSNPLLDSRVYEVQFSDGHTEEFAANTIAENIYSQVDDEGNQYVLLKEIIDHRKNASAISIDDKWIEHGSNRQLRRTTQGWQLNVLWRDGSTSWEHLRNLKESNPIQVAEYAVANKLVEEAAFAWWVPHVLKRRERIIGALNSRYHKRTHKFGIEVPKSVKRALEIDKETGTDFWEKAILKEMKHVRPAFHVLEEDERIPVGSQWIPCHMVFDIKVDFTRKARFVAGGHMTEAPKNITYSSVVSRDSIRIAFLLAALNDVDILAADIGNAYLNADTREKVHTTLGIEFGQNMVGKTAIICKALYGLKSSGAAWRAHLAATLHDLQYRSSLADPDVWLRPSVKTNGDFYYEYVIVYVDDILVIAEHPKHTMDCLAKLYRLKEGSVGKPTTYLGAQIMEHRFPEEPQFFAWAMSSAKYVKEAVRLVEQELQKMNKRLPNKIPTPLSSGYRPELDVSPLLKDEEANYYQQLIGVLRWAVELGRIDIAFPVAIMSKYLVQPREGHLNQVFHLFGYLKSHDRSRIVMDASRPKIDEQRFIKQDWTEFYRDAHEPIPPNAPEPRGNSVVMSCFVDSDHAGDKITRRSHTGIIIFVNRAPIIWYSKQQNTVETSTFGSEFVATRIAVELIESLRYKLRMFGVPIDGPTNVYCDNDAVVTNSTKPESQLKKKHNAIAYHRVREAVAANTIRIAKEPTKTNIADMLTKCLGGPALTEMCSRVLW